MAEGQDEDPQRGGVEQPVGGGPDQRVGQQLPVAQQDHQPVGDLLDQSRHHVGLHERDVAGDALHQIGGLPLAPGEQQDGAGEEGDEDQAGDGGEAVERVVPGERDRDQQGQPEDPVEHHGRAHALGGQAEGHRAPGHVEVDEEPVGDRGAGRRAAGDDVAHGQARHVDPEQGEAVRRAGGQHGVAQLGIGGQGDPLEDHPQHDPDHVDLPEQVDCLAGAGQLGQEEVLTDEEDGDDADGPLDLPGNPALPSGGRSRPSRRRFGRRLVVHPHHAGT